MTPTQKTLHRGAWGRCQQRATSPPFCAFPLFSFSLFSRPFSSPGFRFDLSVHVLVLFPLFSPQSSLIHRVGVMRRKCATRFSLPRDALSVKKMPQLRPVEVITSLARSTQSPTPFCAVGFAPRCRPECRGMRFNVAERLVGFSPLKHSWAQAHTHTSLAVGEERASCVLARATDCSEEPIVVVDVSEERRLVRLATSSWGPSWALARCRSGVARSPQWRDNSAGEPQRGDGECGRSPKRVSPKLGRDWPLKARIQTTIGATNTMRRGGAE